VLQSLSFPSRGERFLRPPAPSPRLGIRELPPAPAAAAAGATPGKQLSSRLWRHKELPKLQGSAVEWPLPHLLAPQGWHCEPLS